MRHITNLTPLIAVLFLTVSSFIKLGLLVIAFRFLPFPSAVVPNLPSPWWVYAIYLAIIFCAIMFVYSYFESHRQEKKQQEEVGQRKYTMYHGMSDERVSRKTGSSLAVKEG